jgi:putative oxidoreductase
LDTTAFGLKISPAWLLRVALGIVYLWFGALKLAGISPVEELVRSSYPLLGTFPLYLALTVFELGLGTLLLAGLWKRWTAAAVFFHLLGTFGVLVFAPHIAFYPWFPFLTIDGEFVIKNLVLMAAAVSLLVGVARAPVSAEAKPGPWALVSFVLVGGVVVGLALPYLHQSLRAAAENSAAFNHPMAVTAQQADELAGGGLKSSLVVRGTMVDHCRLLGCWMEVRDRTGEMFVDLAPGGLNARGLADGTRVQLTGHIGVTCEGNVGFIASSMKLLGTY